MVIQRGHGMQADQPIADSAAELVPFLELFGQVLVFRDRHRQVETVEHHLVAFGAGDQPPENRRDDHENVQRPVHQPGQRRLPRRRSGEDLRRRAETACEQSQPDQDEYGQAEHEV
ncbi:hypothetical protein D3C84_939570 [compost metagenome]